jgi:serine/alanine adding enzyme
VYEGACVSCAIFVHHGHYMHYHLSANDPEYYPLCANSLILAEACAWGVHNAKKQLHLGGAFSNELRAFKRQFTRSGLCD